MIETLDAIEPTVWAGCYDSGWGEFITPESFAHPAKFAYGLIVRIVKHMLARGWVEPGDVVADPFGGIGTGGIVCAANGLNWVGVELEPRFVELAKKNFALNPWCRNGECTIIQGDSRNFVSLIGQCEAVVTSPPYAESIDHAPGNTKWDHSKGTPGNLKQSEYGQSPGQLAALPVGDVGAILTSPPYAEGLGHGGQSTGGSHGQRDKNLEAMQDGYGVTEGQLGAMKVGDIAAVVTSPPYAQSVHEGNGIDPTKLTGNKPGKHSSAFAQGYSADAIVTSPPFLGDGINHACTNVGNKVNRNQQCVSRNRAKGIGDGQQAKQIIYGKTPGQLADEPNTYWTAVAEIYRQCLLALKPGGYIACVVKSYVKGGKIVPLPDQTWELLQHVGFEPVERVRAMLVKESSHPGLFDGPVVKKTERKSFFRRLAERKGSPPIDFEEVLFLRKP